MLRVALPGPGGRRLEGWAWIARPVILASFITILFLMPGGKGFCQQAAPATFDVQARRREMLAHLRSIIQFRRSLMPDIQRAGDPNDAVYREQASVLSSQAFTDAFEWARAEAQLLSEFETSEGGSPAEAGEQERLIRFQRDLDEKIKSLQLQMASLESRAAETGKTTAADRRSQRERLKGSIEFLAAVKEVAQRIGETSNANNGVGLLADLYSLQHSVPELQGGVEAKPQLKLTPVTGSYGVITQVEVMLELRRTSQSLKRIAVENDNVSKEAGHLRGPVTAEAMRLMRQSDPRASPGGAVPAPDIAKLKSLAADAVPLSQEILLLEKSRNNLAAWQRSVDDEYRQMLAALVTRVGIMGATLLFIFVGGELFLRMTKRYVRDQRRRRQFLVIRRLVVGTLSGFVLLVGFISNFSSLATFAGFLTAGIAVGLQTVLLSVAAYFFIIGKYGIRIGDRITIASVTGEVIDVGLLRFYLMELAGSGTDLRQTGRVAIFSNAVLFQAGTPLYKQVPGSEYFWRELTVLLSDTADHDMVREAITDAISGVYAGYRSEVERQHRFVEGWLHASFEPPRVESRVIVVAGQFQLWVRFPVQISRGPEIDEALNQALRDLISRRPEIGHALKSIPLLQQSVRG